MAGLALDDVGERVQAGLDRAGGEYPDLGGVRGNGHGEGEREGEDSHGADAS